MKKWALKGIYFLAFAGGELYRLFMPRSARVVIAKQPHIIIKRGHNRQVLFTQDEGYIYYSDTLAK